MAANVSGSSPFLHDNASVYWSFAAWTIVLGVVLMLAPADWFGPSWSYFPEIPHNGFWMGLVCVGLGVAQLVVLWHNNSRRALAILFGLSGFVFWTAGIILAAEGLLGHQGLMESPFLLYVGAHKFTHSAALTLRPRQPIRRK